MSEKQEPIEINIKDQDLPLTETTQTVIPEHIEIPKILQDPNLPINENIILPTDISLPINENLDFPQSTLESETQNILNEYKQLVDIPKHKREIIRRIQNYSKLFEEQIITLKPLLDIEKLKLLDETQLNELFAELKLEVQGNRNVKFVNGLIRNGIQVYENMLSLFTNVNGLSDAILADDEFLLDVKELIFEFDSSFTSLDPKKRILLSLLKYTFFTIKKNQQFNPPKIKNVYINNADIDKYKDL
jgi:hypothetical protein